MSATTDKVKGTINKAAGSVKEKVGDATGDDRMAVDGAAARRRKARLRRRSAPPKTPSRKASTGLIPPIAVRSRRPRRSCRGWRKRVVTRFAAIARPTLCRGPKHDIASTRQRVPPRVADAVGFIGKEHARHRRGAQSRCCRPVRLYVKTKNFHWHMSGPHFRDYHLLLDEQGEQIYASIDPLAERVAQARSEHHPLDRPDRKTLAREGQRRRKRRSARHARRAHRR